MKIDKNIANAMHMLVMKNGGNNIMYFMQELHTFL